MSGTHGVSWGRETPISAQFFLLSTAFLSLCDTDFYSPVRPSPNDWYRLGITDLSPSTEETKVKASFAAHGKVVGIQVHKHLKTLRSRCTAVVLFKKASDAAKALAALDGQALDGNTIQVEIDDDEGQKESKKGDSWYLRL
jgi:RNA recognition motif-containing protein